MKRTLLVLSLLMSPLMADPSQDAFDAAVKRYEQMVTEKYGALCAPEHPLTIEATRLMRIFEAAQDPLMTDASYTLVLFDMAAVRLGYARAVIVGAAPAAPPVAARRPAAPERPSAVASELSELNKQLRAAEEQRRLEFLMEFSQRTGKR